MTCCTVSEIHAYPVNPPCHQEVLFDLPESKREVADHLLKASWLCRASEMKVRRGGSGDSAHVLREVVEVRRKGEGVEVLRQDDWRRHAWKKRVVEEVLDRAGGRSGIGGTRTSAWTDWCFGFSSHVAP
jgi:hypothetical protein